MVIHSCARYGMTISEDKITGQNSKPCQNPKRFDLGVNIVSSHGNGFRIAPFYTVAV